MFAIAPDLSRRLERILCVGAHADDIEIGCAGTLLQLVASRPDIEFDWVVLSAEGVRAKEAQAAAERIIAAPDRARIRIESFEERYFPAHYGNLKRYFDELGRWTRPDLIFAPRQADAHQDHRTVCELVWQTFRDQPILEYEIAKYEGDLGSPNAYIALDSDSAERKLALLFDVFESQHARDWFDDMSFRALLRLRGIECRAPSGYAEAFYAPKLRIC